MESWSDIPIDNFKIKVYLDTMLLSYLIDNSFSELTKFIEILKNSEFVQLVSSKFVILEFIGVRKREHFLREAVEQRRIAGKINLLTIFNNKQLYNIKGIKFNSVQGNIETNVVSELDIILNNYSIEYNENELHNNLFSPAKDILLKTTIANQDSLVLISAIYPDIAKHENFILVLSNDDEFTKACTSDDNPNYNAIFTNLAINKPIVENINKIYKNDGTDTHKTLLDEPIDDLDLFTKNKILNLIKLKNENLYLGKTIPCGRGQNFPLDTICFELKENTPLNKDIYITIVNKNLNFVYSTKIIINDFWNNTSIAAYPFVHPETKNISFKIKTKDDNGADILLEQDIIDKLRETGNLVFISPDSI